MARLSASLRSTTSCSTSPGNRASWWRSSRANNGVSVSTASERGGMVAYFSMEIGIDPDVPTYAGGLGVLAGDFIRAAADLGLPLVAVTLLHRKGYFRQRL